ncbi:MAG: hypothetical protein JWM64_1302 [Frankiales bacterium]|nr:hypothetical protein [Frankiales bacterium]
MAVGVLVDAPAAALLEALDAVRDTPAPLGQVPVRLTVLARASAELQGTYLRDLHHAEQSGEHLAVGCRSVADLLVEHAGLPVSQARSDAALARRLGVLPGLLDTVAGGGLELPAARQLARAWTALPERLRDQPTARALITLGGLVDLADLKAKVDELLGALQPEVTDDALAAAYDDRELTLVDVGAQTRLDGHGDALEGEWLREVLQAKAENDRTDTDPRNNGARLWDALLDCVRAAVSTPGVVPRPEDLAPTLIAIATADDLLRTADLQPDVVAPEDALADLLAGTIDHDLQRDRDQAADSGQPGEDAAPSRPVPWTARTRGGVRLGPRTLSRLSCESALTRLLLDPAGHPIDSSPLARQLTRRQRRALEHRADHRCQRTGCGRPAWACVPHHIIPFALGGPTTLANTALLCRSCHHLLHDRQQPLELTDGSRIGPHGPLRAPPEDGAALPL